MLTTIRLKANIFLQKTWKIALLLAIVVFLTLLTEVGGLIFLLLYLAIRWFVSRWDIPQLEHFWLRQLTLTICFLGIYTLTIFWIIPPLARLNGKVPLPLEHPYLRPAHGFYAWCNRHYVTPNLRNVLEESATQFARQFIGGQVFFLDAGFPFGKVPLPPHLTHRGTQVDLSFCYADALTGKAVNRRPSVSGYGVFESPHSGEPKTCDFCKERGYSLYDFSKYLTFGSNPKAYRIDEARSKALLQIFVKNPKISKILIEPHLEQRWGLTSFGKVRFHGCQAARHDDHFHVEVFN